MMSQTVPYCITALDYTLLTRFVGHMRHIISYLKRAKILPNISTLSLYCITNIYAGRGCLCEFIHYITSLTYDQYRYHFPISYYSASNSSWCSNSQKKSTKTYKISTKTYKISTKINKNSIKIKKIS